MGTRSCGPLGSHVPAFLDFSFVFHIPAFLFHIFSQTPVLLHSCFEFLCSCVKECLCGGWGCNSSHERCVCMDGSGGLGQLATTPLPPLITRRSVRVNCREAGLRSNLCLVHNHPLPPLLSVHVITMSYLYRNGN